MKLVVDANIIFAALIKEGMTGELLISDDLFLFAPEFLLEEFAKYETLILEKTHRAKEDFDQFLKLLKECITFIHKEEIIPYLKQAEIFSPDPKDSVYLALALKLKCPLWSNDKKLKEEQDKIKSYSTEELTNLVRFLK